MVWQLYQSQEIQSKNYKHLLSCLWPFTQFLFKVFCITLWIYMILWKNSRVFPSVSFIGIFQELSSLPTEQPFYRTPLMSLSYLTDAVDTGVNWTYIRRSEDVQDVFWMSYVCSIYVLWLLGSSLFTGSKHHYSCSNKLLQRDFYFGGVIFKNTFQWVKNYLNTNSIVFHWLY